jgi:hypothetical protein
MSPQDARVRLPVLSSWIAQSREDSKPFAELLALRLSVTVVA